MRPERRMRSKGECEVGALGMKMFFPAICVYFRGEARGRYDGVGNCWLQSRV
jgi:hypothetical protein